mmetsp:Transcript_6187/g.6959  ORF Transcript_6187/g.6959 Transcript_6187/m.6959 type:complete len:342 (+) Transcript_6187:86-1111(+)
MKVAFFVCFVVVVCISGIGCLPYSFKPLESADQDRVRPVVGIMSQEPSSQCEDYNNATSYIAASYVKYVESAGARVVPLRYTDSFETLGSMMDKINGVILPGGGTPLLIEEGEQRQWNADIIFDEAYTQYMNAVAFIVQVAKSKNDQGTYFPVLGICLGLQSMILAEINTKEIEHSDSTNERVSQNFVNRDQSRWFSTLPEDLVELAQNTELVYENHHDCYTTQYWNDHTELGDTYFLTSVAYDDEGLEYVNAIEGITYPFYAVQYHPEKVQFEWRASSDFPHDIDSLRYSSFIALKFGSEIRKNSQTFESENEENEAMIYNTPILFSATGYYFELYCFDS